MKISELFPSRDGDGRRAPRVPFALLVGGLIVGSLLLLLALNTASAANELERHGLARKDDAAAASLQDLKVRVARSAAPENLARAAADLGMVPAGNPAFVVVGPDGKAVLLGKPKKATAPPVVVPKAAASTAAAPATSPVATAPVATAPPTGTTVPGRTPTPGATAPATAPATARATATAPVTRPVTPTSTPTPEITLPGGTR